MARDYWHESLSLALEDTPLFDAFWALDEAARNDIAEALAISAENEGMASGRECIPNPLESQMREQARRAAEAREATARDHSQVVRDLERTISRLRSRLDEALREQAR